MDVNKLQVAVYEKTGIRIDEADPVFALIALNETILGELLSVFDAAMEKNNSDLDEKIGGLVAVHRNILAASKELAERADQAHLMAALKAATEARTEIMHAARDAVSNEVTKASSVVANAAHQLAIVGEKVKENSSRSWTIAMAQAVIGGMVAGSILIASQQLK